MDAGGPGRANMDTSIVGRSLENMANELDDTLSRAARSTDAMQEDIDELQASLREVR